MGKILRSPWPHARIVRLDTSRAEAMPGVRAVVTGDDNLAKFGVLPISKDEVALAVGKVIYVGDCVAGVAAEDEETALAASSNPSDFQLQMKTLRRRSRAAPAPGAAADKPAALTDDLSSMLPQ